jgi:HK97 gp10 family phage protein
MKETMRVEGFKELESALKELPRATGKNCIRRALARAAAPIVAAAKAKAPARPGSGKLREAIIFTKVKFTGGNAGKQAYAEAMRQGKTRAEAADAAREANIEAQAEAGDALLISGIANIAVDYRKAWYAHFVEFGTAKATPKPFMRPAWDAGKYRAAEAIRDTLKEEIDKAVARIARKTLRATQGK